MKKGSVTYRSKEHSNHYILGGGGGSRRIYTPLLYGMQIHNNHAFDKPILVLPFLKENIVYKYLCTWQRKKIF